MKNKARVEGSIYEAYLIEETSTFASFYFPSEIDSRRTRIQRNIDVFGSSSNNPQISIFNYPGRPAGTETHGFLEDRDLLVAHLYVLQNCDEVQPFIQ